VGTTGVGKVVGGARWTALVILVSPGLAHAYVDPTGGGFLLQLLLGGATGVILIGRVFIRRVSERILRRFRRPQ
jgi:hypothetical protein